MPAPMPYSSGGDGAGVLLRRENGNCAVMPKDRYLYGPAYLLRLCFRLFGGLRRLVRGDAERFVILRS